MMQICGLWCKFIQQLLWRRGRWAHWIRTGSTMLFWFGGPAAYKLDSNDVQTIKIETGQHAADLTEAKLVAAMRILGIRKLALNQTDVDALRLAEANEIC